MTPPKRAFELPGEAGLGLSRILNGGGLMLSALPNGGLFAIEHEGPRGRIMINQVLGSPLDGGIGRVVLRLGGADAHVVTVAGAGARGRFGAAEDRFVWEGETGAIRHRVTLWLHPQRLLWLWVVDLAVDGGASAPVPCDVVLIQDVGLGERGFLMNCEAYGSQYTDHTIASHPGFGPVIMNRQNLAQGGRHPWLAHGCLDGGAGFATDALQLFGPAHRDDGGFALGYGADLPDAPLQHEAACVAIRSHSLTLAPGGAADLTFFGLFEPDHPEASGDADLLKTDAVAEASKDYAAADVALAPPVRSVLQDAAPLAARPLPGGDVGGIWPERLHEEHGSSGELLSFFAPTAPHNRHVVMAAKERLQHRRHGTILRSGEAFLPSESTLCATAWMHGVFGAQAALGNVSLHKLFSVSRDAYNITRSSGLRILADTGEGWRLLTVPSAFEMGLGDCRWIYRTAASTITVHLIASVEDAALAWRVTVGGEPCRFLVFAHLVLGEREYERAGRAEIDAGARRITMRFDPASLWGQRYPEAVFHLTACTPDGVETVGGDELLYADGQTRGGPYIALQTLPTRDFAFAVTGSLRSAEGAGWLAAKYRTGIDAASILEASGRLWQRITGPIRLDRTHDAAAHDTLLPWLAHNALIHLSAPHGLEQYSGGAWGTRDVCQGPVEFLLALEHDSVVKDILRLVFAQQYAPAAVDASGRSELAGDWPQWFMLEPYSFIQGAPSHGDIIVWPLKALCDYIEATGDFAFLDEPLAWRSQRDFTTTARKDTVAAHVATALATARSRFIPGTHLIRIGEGDWNDALQPADPSMRDNMVSSWTVALLHHQLGRWAEVLRRAGREDDAAEIAALASQMRDDFQCHLIRDGTVAGYAMFSPSATTPELLLHPSETRTGVRHSLLPMTRGILAGLFTPEQVQHHLRLIREHLLYPDGVRLMDRMLPYRGGAERLFRRAESAAFVGREISLMYVHAHLRYCETMALLGEDRALGEGLAVVNPILVTERLTSASPRQRNAYFTSSDAAFASRHEAEERWEDLRTGAVPVDGGWRIYSSGPGIYLRLLVQTVAGRRRVFGERRVPPAGT